MMETIPTLRFHSFSDSWQTRAISDVGKIVTGGTPDTSNRELYGGEFMFVSPTDIGDARYVEETTKTLTAAGHKIGRRVPKGSILFVCIGSTIGKVAQASAECTTNQQINAVVPDEDHDSNFLLCVLDKQSTKIRLLAGKQAVPIINKTSFSCISISVPTLPEQRKIAEFLTAVDGRIAQLERKKALLEDYKKGVMQQLFTQAIRFKDDHGKDFPEWEEKKLKEVAKIYDGTHTTPSYTKTGVPFYSVEHLTRGCFRQTKFISEKVFEKENTRVMLERGDILMTRIGDIGTSRHLDWDVRASFYVSLCLLKLDRATVDPEFASQSISSRSFQRELWQRTIHVAFPKKINLGEIGECKMKIPSLAEQTKIAEFLTSLDRKIEGVGRQIAGSKDFKRGLLQQMFV